jgi:two-component system, LytTR family, response regulator LytT
MKVLIIEDERKAAHELQTILSEIRPAIKVLDILESVDDAVEWFSHHDEPDLIFCDIQLADGLSFDIFRQVKLSAPVVFCTAFDEYVQNAFDANGINYLLKPINAEKLAKSLDSYDNLKKAFNKDASFLEKMEKLLGKARPYKSTILVHQKGKIIPVKVNDIAFFRYDNGVISVSLFNNQTYFINDTLEDIESSLDPSAFFRANRQFLINRQSVQNVERYFARKIIVKLSVKTPEEITISKVRVNTFLSWLEAS